MPHKKWTILAYIVADHEGIALEDARALDAVAIAEVNALLAAADLNQVNVAVQVDFTDIPGAFRVINRSRRLERETGAARLDTITSFMDKVSEAGCTADHYLFLFWGHGSGPIGMFHDANVAPAIRQAPETLSLLDVQNVLAHFTKTFYRPVDILLVKSCCMAMIEAAWQIEGLADAVICSQGRVPAREWRYSDMVAALLDTASPRPVANRVLDAVAVQAAEAARRAGRREVPYSLVHPRSIRDVLEQPLQRLSTAMAAGLAAGGVDADALRQAIEASRPDGVGDNALVDLAILCSKVVDLGPSLQAFGPAAAVLDKLAVGGPIVDAHVPDKSAFRGLSVFYMPKPAQRVDSFANDVTTVDYRTLAFDATLWRDVAFSSDLRAPAPLSAP